MKEIKLDERKPVRINLSPKKKLMIAGVASGVILLGLLIFWWIRSEPKPVDRTEDRKASSTVCNQSMITKAAPLIDDNQGPALTKLAGEIMEMPGFDKDANCLYIVTYSYINATDPGNSRKYYDKLVEVYNPQAGFSSSFGSTTTTLEGFKTQVEFLESQNEAPNYVDKEE